jgi:hypothetical protein
MNVNVRQTARSVFRLAAAIDPKTDGQSRPRSLLDPLHLARAGLLTARFGSEVIENLWRGPRAAIGYVELDNKVRAFHFFENEVAHLESRQTILLPGAAIRDARERLGHEQAVWATEGIGYELFERGRRTGRPTRDLFAATSDDVPPGSWTVLHTGMGMALAEMGIEGARSAHGPSALKARLEGHLQSCRDSARAGYVELAFEPLGLVTRLLGADLVLPFAEQFDRIGSVWSDLFWHGVGRGLYFLPVNLAPSRSAPWVGLRMCRTEPPNEAARRNAAAGFAWAVTLVNLRRPAVVEAFLDEHLGGADGDAPVAQGVLSALLLWHEATRGSRELRQFVGHVAEPERRSLWQRVVRGPFEEAARSFELLGTPDRERRVSELFRYREGAGSGAKQLAQSR